MDQSTVAGDRKEIGEPAGASSARCDCDVNICQGPRALAMRISSVWGSAVNTLAVSMSSHKSLF